jgi:hypothetical protein
VGEQLLRAQRKKEHRSVVEPSKAHQSGVKMQAKRVLREILVLYQGATLAAS